MKRILTRFWVSWAKTDGPCVHRHSTAPQACRCAAMREKGTRVMHSRAVIFFVRQAKAADGQWPPTLVDEE